MVDSPRHSLRATLDLERIDDHYFRGITHDVNSLRVFGGQVAGQALVAAGRTVDTEKTVHSLHAYFLRPGDSRIPIVYDVDVIRDGRSFSTRRVVAIQNGEAIFNLAASFQRPETGVVHQVAVLDAPPPEEVPLVETQLAGADDATLEWYGDLFARFPIDVRFVDGLPVRLPDGSEQPPRRRIWLKSAEPLGDEPLTHVCAAAYASDLFLLGAALSPHRLNIRSRGLSAVSIDHAMWFHRPFRADEWMLYDQEGSWTGHGRGLSRGLIFDRDGDLLATVIQEGLIRVTS